MATRKVTSKTILREEEVAAVTAGLRSLFGGEFSKLTVEYKVNVEDIVRFGAVAKRLQEARESRGLSVKEVALALDVPQSRVRDFERSHVSAKDWEAVRDYAALLGLSAWYRRWLKQNAVVFHRAADGAA